MKWGCEPCRAPASADALVPHFIEQNHFLERLRQNKCMTCVNAFFSSFIIVISEERKLPFQCKSFVLSFSVFCQYNTTSSIRLRIPSASKEESALPWPLLNKNKRMTKTEAINPLILHIHFYSFWKTTLELARILPNFEQRIIITSD